MRGLQLLPSLFLLLLLPPVGLWLSGTALTPTMTFPPRATALAPGSYSWPVFLLVALAIASTLAPVILQIARSHYTGRLPVRDGPSTGHPCTHPPLSAVFRRRHWINPLPWWGWVGLVWTAFWWVIAWTRLPWAAALQPHTFIPLWLGYILIVNAWTYRTAGHCLLRDRPGDFLGLFPLSAAYWWLFEYLNQFVHNWAYRGPSDLSDWDYALRASLSFATVLPAVLSTAELLATVPRLSAGLDRFIAVPHSLLLRLAWLSLVITCAGLLGLGLSPEHLYPLVWLAPLALLVSTHTIAGQPTVFSDLVQGDGRRLWLAALSALICGLWWELWNWGSFARWEYGIPYLHGVQLFEMPILGYAGYLPFGLTSVIVAECVVGSRLFTAPGADSREDSPSRRDGLSNGQTADSA